MPSPSDKTRIILLINPQKAQAKSVGRDLREWLRGRAEVVADNLEGELELSRLPEADFIIVLGGDGTILSTARALEGRELPLIGVNMGKLGFLAEFSLEELQEQFDEITSAETPYRERIQLNCRITGPGRPDFESLVVNDIAIIAGPPFRMIEVSIRIGDEPLASCAGDGLIVATPTGSTAYNLSAGGPILASTLKAAVITPLAAHSLSFRPLVVDLDKTIELRCRDVHTPEVKGEMTDMKGAVVVIDGQDHTPLKSEDKITISAASRGFLLVPNPRTNAWRLLNQKLHWGALPNYGGSEEGNYPPRIPR
jgi:NAD+ kinase